MIFRASHDAFRILLKDPIIRHVYNPVITKFNTLQEFEEVKKINVINLKFDNKSMYIEDKRLKASHDDRIEWGLISYLPGLSYDTF